MTNKIWLGANKLDQNPVESGFVTDSSDWKYSSARIIAIMTRLFWK